MQLQGKAQGEEGNGSKREVKVRSKGAFTPYCMRLCPASHKEGRRAGPQWGQDPQGSVQFRTCKCNASQAHLSKMPSGPLPCRLLSEMCHRNVLSHVDLFLLHCWEQQPLSWHKHPTCQSSDPHVAQSPQNQNPNQLEKVSPTPFSTPF